MKQLLLDIRAAPPPTLDSFVCGRNGELLARLHALASPKCFDSVYMWGAAGSGRSHLLRGTQAAAEALGRPVVRLEGAMEADDLPLPTDGLLIVDDVDLLTSTGQLALFRAFNTARLIGLAILLAGNAPPLQLVLREDLRTRIGAALIYEVQALSDEEKAEALSRHAKGRGLRLEQEVIDYLLHHGARDLPSLMAVLEAADQASLEQKRPLSIPFLKEITRSMVQ